MSDPYDPTSDIPDDAMPDVEQSRSLSNRESEHTRITVFGGSGNKAVVTSYDFCGPSGRALFTRCLSPAEESTGLWAGKVVESVGYVAHVFTNMNDDGEEVTVRRLVLVLADGSLVSTCSKPVIETFGCLVNFYGKSPWNPPIKFRVTARKGKQAGPYYTLEEVFDAAGDESTSAKMNKRK